MRKFKTVNEDQNLLLLDQSLFIRSALYGELLSKLYGPHRSLLHMRRTIAIKFIAEGYTRKAEKFLINCKECQTALKSLNKLISSLPKAKFSSERIHIDNMVNGKSKICVINESVERVQIVAKINSSISVDKLTNCQLFEMGKASDISAALHDRNQQLWNIHNDEVVKEPQDPLESSDAESTITAAAPLNDDNESINYLPDRCVN
uniref:Integrase_H2C2 domain-containing protein n=1 Tax=Strongyloides venezuelensis TaxID=75913 RepID=A0A0K0FRW3_STRVS